MHQTVKAVIVTMALLMAGCMPRAVTPLVTLEYDLAPGNNKLVVLLPGSGENLGRIQNRGLFEVIGTRGYDVIVADLHLAYYIEGSFLRSLRDDVIVQAREKGYKSIWLVGNSLGGYGALFYIKTHPEDIDGIILLGPFLGDKELIEEIETSGGVQKWEPGDVADDDYDRELWNWIKQAPSSAPPVFLCYGNEDRFSGSQALLASVLPPGRVVAIKGGHDWKSWKRAWDILFTRHIENSDLPLP